jgi:phospholipid-binding lipoprotein MlaA
VIVTGRKASPDDPLEEINATSFKVTQKVDESIVAPVAFAYGDVMPRPIRQGLRNFLHNLGEPIVFLNYMLQLKPGKAAETLGRFAVNTALGAGGLVDIAKRKPFNLPHRNNGFANTLGYYGVKPGPYFYLPLVGPTTLRDFLGDRVDLLVFPTFFGNSFRKPVIITPIFVLNELNRRIEIDDEIREIQATRDPYVAARTYYLQKRQAEIDALHGRKASSPAVTPPAPAAIEPPPAPVSPAPAQEPSPTP